MMRIAAPLAFALLVAGCGGGSDAPAEPAETTIASVPLDGARIVVDADGLGAKGQPPLRFGADRAEVDALAEAAFGTKGTPSSNGECGAGPMDFTEFGPLQIAYLDGKFAGWFLRPGDGVVTSDGIQPGVTTLPGLKLEREVREVDTTLEGEFEYTTAAYGTIRGFAEGDDIAALQAGVSCFFR